MKQGKRQHKPAFLKHLVVCSIILLLSFTFIGCSPSFLKKEDYRASIRNLSRGDPEKALSTFPEGEEDTFITTMETTYLNLVQGKPEIDDLEKYSLIIDNRLRYKVSREIKSFFYADTPEEYYASEHEIIWLHLLLGWGYSIKGEFEKACIEARKGAHLLTYTWSEEGHFDDPMLRVFLTGLWTMCGSWEDTRVDLRAAYLLDKSMQWARELSERDDPPRYLFMILGGIGPKITWNPELEVLNPLRGIRQIEFTFPGRKSPLAISDRGGKHVTVRLSPDSSGWYERHLLRDNEIHELIMDSRYGNQLFTETTYGVGKITAGTAAGVAIGAVSVGIGGGLVYLGSSSGSGDLVELGLIVAAAGIAKGYKVARRTVQDSVREMEKGLDPSDRYRFVRFLPEYIWMGWSDDELSFPLLARTRYSSFSISAPTVINETTVIVLHVPDVF